MNKLIFPDLLHGGDYNPDQWLDCPEILIKDIELMKKADVNCVSLAIFAWTALEPEEGMYRFDWLEDRVNTLFKNGIYTILATPSGARPAWLAEKYTEVLRVDRHHVRQRFGMRHNHCYTSPVYREKVWEMNKRLAERFGRHEGVILWHLSNEYMGECYCPLCQDGFREWLKRKYGSLDAINKAWWSAFWNHTYTSWSQIEAPVPHGEMLVHGLVLDWKRYVTDMTVDFCRWEKESVRAGGSELPVTTNFMGLFDGLNYGKFKNIIDIASWDSYPEWHTPEKSNHRLAVETACAHDFIRSIKQEPFLLMESTPSVTNWRPISKLKRSGMHMLSSLQAIAHGANSVLYFQWRKSRGSSEKFHGAVVDHYGESDTRIFNDVADVGARLKRLRDVISTVNKSKAAIVFDQENRWALGQIQGPRNAGLHYIDTIIDHYEALWKLGVSADIIDSEYSFERYDLVIVPMLYMFRAGIEEKLRDYASKGGTLVATCLTGVADENDLCFLGGVPGKMMDVFGLRTEEIDALYEGESNSTDWNGKKYKLHRLCERVIPSTAKVLSVYETDFYAGEPALCENEYKDGTAYYLAAHCEQTLLDDFYKKLTFNLGINNKLFSELPHGVTDTMRYGEREFHFLQNFNDHPINVNCSTKLVDVENGEVFESTVELPAFAVRIIAAASTYYES